MSIDTKKLDEYAKQAKEIYGATPQYQEFREKTRSKSKSEMQAQGEEIMSIVAEFGKLKALPANDPAVQRQVKKLQDFITENYYTCAKKHPRSAGADVRRRGRVYRQHQRRRRRRRSGICQ